MWFNAHPMRLLSVFFAEDIVLSTASLCAVYLAESLNLSVWVHGRVKTFEP